MADQSNLVMSSSHKIWRHDICGHTLWTNILRMMDYIRNDDEHVSVYETVMNIFCDVDCGWDLLPYIPKHEPQLHKWLEAIINARSFDIDAVNIKLFNDLLVDKTLYGDRLHTYKSFLKPYKGHVIIYGNFLRKVLLDKVVNIKDNIVQYIAYDVKYVRDIHKFNKKRAIEYEIIITEKPISKVLNDHTSHENRVYYDGKVCWVFLETLKHMLDVRKNQ